MKQEDKKLLLKDLCARLPYGIKCKLSVDGASLVDDLQLAGLYQFLYGRLDVIPYLRPLSSITEEEFESLKKYTGLEYDQLEMPEWGGGCKTLEFYLNEIPSYVVIMVFDWLNSHHFDYRGLIEKGLALEAPKGMYEIK